MAKKTWRDFAMNKGYNIIIRLTAKELEDEINELRKSWYVIPVGGVGSNLGRWFQAVVLSEVEDTRAI